MRYFLHVYIAPCTEHGISYPDAVAAVPIQKWSIHGPGLRVEIDVGGKRPQVHFYSFNEGCRYFIVENHGQCWEPNGDIIWRWTGDLGDEKAAA